MQLEERNQRLFFRQGGLKKQYFQVKINPQSFFLHSAKTYEKNLKKNHPPTNGGLRILLLILLSGVMNYAGGKHSGIRRSGTIN